MKKGKPRVLITGAAGGLSQLVARNLVDAFEVVGVDPRPIKNADDFPGATASFDYRSRKLNDLFEENKFSMVLHLGRVPVMAELHDSARFNMNVLGTRNILEHVRNHKVGKVIVLSTFHVYGAHPHNHLYLTEDDPLLASQTFPEIADAVELDNVSTNFSLRYPEVVTTILRPSNIVGPTMNNTITRYLRGPICPMLMGYDPIVQFTHEQNFVRALRAAIDQDHRGIFNLSGPGVISMSKAIATVGARPTYLPEFLSKPALRILKIAGVHFPTHLVEFFKYPVVISDKAFTTEFGYTPELSMLDTLQSIIR